MSTKTTPDAPPPPLAGGGLDLAMAIAAVVVVALVGWSFSFEVNRVFDVPKAVALKVGGSGLFLLWLGYGLIGPGWPWKSARLFAAPALALAGVVFLSTLASIDPWMSLQGVYERQFGLQGMISCLGLFFVVSTTLRSKRGAIGALGALALIGGVIGGYSALQSFGHDPYDFFPRPHNKVYSTLGNATFAGNALALIFPISFILATVGTARALAPERWKESPGHPMLLVLAWGLGLALVAALFVLPGWTSVPPPELKGEARRAALEHAQMLMKLGMGLATLGTLALALTGSWGPELTRAESPSARRALDAALAGAIMACALGIAAGLAFTRTRGAWVGTAFALCGGLALLPGVFRDDPKLMRRMRIGGIALLLAAVGGVATMLTVFPTSLFSATVLSIPHAFNPESTVYGQGQGTRRYLWAESPRVLFDHDKTLARQAADRDDLRTRAKGLPSLHEEPSAIRRALVWPLGIGIETYRYAFMSHKSKKLEALDPMTNHDNPHNNYLYILASCGVLGLLAYLWLLWRLLSVAWRKFNGEGSRTDRALAFGVVTSFFSYAVYSVAGFDSVACSVFLYLLLGATAVLFEPSEGEPRRSPLSSLADSYRSWRKTQGQGVPVGLAAGAGILVLLCGQTVLGALRVWEAETSFVARGNFEQRVAGMKRAIEINPRESFYWQSLGGLYLDAASQYRDIAARAQEEGQEAEAKGYLARAQGLIGDAEKAMYSALDHAWAPENIYISLFQLYYGARRYDEAERALERALQHSPHLGPVRANLAVLELERGAYEEAIADCAWVLDVEPGNMMALRTCGRASQKLGKLSEARAYLERARAGNANDKAVTSYLKELDAAEAPKTSTGAAPG